MILSILFPFVFIFCTGFSWGVFFKKSFEESLAPSMMAQSVIVLSTGLFLHNLRVGILVGLLFSALLLGIAYRCSSQKNGVSFSKYCSIELEKIIYGVICFVIIYLAIYMLNIGKRFLYWDEYMHWGFFLKESLRLNALYCTSPLAFHHKDYVPMITVFEYIYCIISGGQVETNAYRAIQIMSFSMIIYPICVKKAKDNLWKSVFCASLLIFLPFMFNQDNGFKLYHSVYIDYILGIIVFYSICIVFKNEENIIYQVFLLVLSCTFLVLSKMIAIVFVPAIFALYIVKRIITVQGNSLVKLSQLLYFILIIVPLAFWRIFNLYVNQFVNSSGNIQSYSGINFAKIVEPFSNPATSSISYLGIVRDNYIRALFTRDILIHGSYVVIILIIVVFLGCVSIKKSDKVLLLTSFWIFCTAIYYAVVMYVIYIVAFSEREAKILASYERYMNTFVVAAVYFSVVCLLPKLAGDKQIYYFKCLVLVYVLFILLGHITAMDQLIPGSMMKDYEKIQMFEEKGNYILKHTNDKAKIFVAYSGSELKDFRDFIELRYFCYPRIIDGVNGEMSANDYYSKLRQCDFLYVLEVDDDYLTKYEGVFTDASCIYNNSIYRIVDKGDGISLEYIY